jgi:serine/threonine protein kinase
MGIAKLYENNMKMTAIGCRDYMPPEFYTGRYSKKLDIYTYGLTLNEIFNGIHRLIQRSREIVIEREADVFYHIVKVCISKDDRDRPEAKLLEKELMVFENCIDSAISKNLYTYMKNKNEFFKNVYNKALIAYRSTGKQYIENKF